MLPFTGRPSVQYRWEMCGRSQCADRLLRTFFHKVHRLIDTKSSVCFLHACCLSSTLILFEFFDVIHQQDAHCLCDHRCYESSRRLPRNINVIRSMVPRFRTKINNAITFNFQGRHSSDFCAPLSLAVGVSASRVTLALSLSVTLALSLLSSKQSSSDISSILY